MSSFYTIAHYFDWREYIESNFTYKPTDRGAELRVCCPACLESKYKCYVNPEKRVFNCFKCEFSSRTSDVFDFVAKTESLTRNQAVLRLFQQYKDFTAENVEFGVDKPKPSKVALRVVSLPKNTHSIFVGNTVREMGQPYLDYLVSRGFTPLEVKQASTLFCVKSPPDDEDDVSKRVVWPVYSGDGVLVSWVSRDITDKHYLKYKNAKNSDISKALWPNVSPKTTSAVIVEGIPDCMALRRLGYDAYCTFGKKISEAQVELLQAWGITEVILFWDKKDAKKQMQLAAEYLTSRFTTYVADLRDWPANKDAGNYLSDQTLGPAIVKAITDSIHPESVDYIDWIMH